MRTSIIMDLVDRVTRPVRRIQQTLGGLARRSGLDRVGMAARGVTQAVGGTLNSVRSLTRRLTIMGGVAAGAAWGLNRLIQGFTGPADEAIKMSRSVSATHREMQLLIGASERMTQLSAGELSRNMVRFDRRLSEAARGMGEAAQAYDALDIATRDANGNLRSSMDVMREVADLMAGIEDQALRGEIAYRLYGDRSGEMVNLLQEGSEELERQMEIFERTGQVVSGDAARSAEEYNDNLSELTGTVKGLRNSVLSELLPAFNDWLKQQAELIQQNDELITERLLDGIERFWEGVQNIAAALRWASSMLGGWERLLIAVAAVMAGPLLLSLANLTVALTKFGIVLLTTPVGWFLAAVAALAASVYVIYRNWDEIAEWFSDRIARVREAFDQGLVQGVMALLRQFSPVGLVADAINDMVAYVTGFDMASVGREWIGGFWEGITERWSQLTSWLSDQMERLTSWMPDWARDRLGLEGLGAPEGSLGQAAMMQGAGGAGSGSISRPEARVGGELRISIDSEGRPRVREVRREGGMDLDVDAGMLGVAQ